VELEHSNLLNALAGSSRKSSYTSSRARIEKPEARVLQSWHIIHWAGHGGCDRHTGEGFIVLDGKRGSERLDASMLGLLAAGAGVAAISGAERV
jgi:hypothetical protein